MPRLARVRSLFALAFCVSVCGLNAQAPGLQVRILASNGIPLSGALVALIDQQGNALAEGLTGENGARTFAQGRGIYRVRVRRIGYQPYFSGEVTLPRTGEFVVRVDEKRIVLSAMVITATDMCGQLNRNSEALALVWEEIAKALRSSQLTAADLENLARARIYRKEIDAHGHVTKIDSTNVPIQSRKPFRAIDPESLARDGYVRGNQSTGWEYFGIDETVLLSESFIATHCFRLTRDKGRPGQVGMTFEPISGRSRADVKGVLWLDEKASELRDIEFSFVNAGLLSRFNASGFTKFRRLPSGAWIVEEWKLRAPILLAIRSGAREQISVTGYVEEGGGVVIK